MAKCANMIYEIIEALENYYGDDDDVTVDCMKFLQDKISDLNVTCATMEWFNSHERCRNCGEKLEYRVSKVVHTELDGCPSEKVIEPYCPNCGKEFIN